MNSPKLKKTADETIGKLIRAEEEDALARFRAIDFGTAVQQRIEETRRPEAEPRIASIRRRPAWAGLAAAFAIAAAGVIMLLRPAPGSELIRSIESVLRSTTLGEKREALPSSSRPIPGGSPAPGAVTFGALIADRLGASSAPSPDDGAKEKPESVRPLSLEEIYKIAIVDRSIERVLKLATS